MHEIVKVQVAYSPSGKVGPTKRRQAVFDLAAKADFDAKSQQGASEPEVQLPNVHDQ